MADVLLCRRCGTILRNNRPVCPSCGHQAPGIAMTLASKPAAAGKAAVAAPVGAEKPKGKKAICPLCLNSVDAESLAEHEGQRICPACIETKTDRGRYAKQAAQGGGLLGAIMEMKPDLGATQEIGGPFVEALPPTWSAANLRITVGGTGAKVEISSPEKRPEKVSVTPQLKQAIDNLLRARSQAGSTWKSMLISVKKEPDGNWNVTVVPDG